MSFSLADMQLHRAAAGIAACRRTPFRTIPPRRTSPLNSRRQKILPALERLGWVGDFLRGCVVWSNVVARGIAARKGLPAFKKRNTSPNPFLFVTYFPAVDEEAAGRGVFRNKYAAFLQDKLKAENIPVNWLLMPNTLDGYDFGAALKLADTFSKNGERLFVLEEFLTLRVAIKGFFLWLRQIAVGLFLFQRLKKTGLTAEPVGRRCGGIVKSLWSTSFCGPIAVSSILYALIFREVFTRLGGVADCLYLCEMHAWEKALNAAKR